MAIYLVRHGEANVDENKPGLSDNGKQQTNAIGKFLKQCGINISVIYHSGKKRAQETAETLATFMENPTITEKAGLKPNDLVSPIVSELNAEQQDVMLVGHLPFLPTLVCELVLETDNHLLVNFTPATIICLERANENHWLIQWMLQPEVLNRL